MTCALFLLGVAAVTFAVVATWPSIIYILRKHQRERRQLYALMGIDDLSQSSIDIDAEDRALITEAEMLAARTNMSPQSVLGPFIRYLGEGHPVLRQHYDALYTRRTPRRPQ